MAPAWLPGLTEAVGGKRLIGDERSEPAKPAELLRLRDAIFGNPEPQPYRQWLNDFFGNDTTP